LLRLPSQLRQSSTWDRLTRDGALVQATLARWQIDGGGITTLDEDGVRIHADHFAWRLTVERWLPN